MTHLTKSYHVRELLDDSKTFVFFHDLFRYPARDRWEWLNSPDVKGALETAGRKSGLNSISYFQTFPGNFEEYEETYIALFEVGLPHPPCPLLESHWDKNNPVSSILHENIMFYKTFGLEIKSNVKESPDHLRFQLEFYSHLLKLQAMAEDGGGNTEQFLQARKDYLHRHLLSWIPQSALKIQETDPESYFSLWIQLLERCIVEQADKLN